MVEGSLPPFILRRCSPSSYCILQEPGAGARSAILYEFSESSSLPVQAVQALYLSTLPVGVGYVTSGKSFSLTSADVLASTFNAAIASFGSGGSPATAPAAAAGAAGGRRLAQVAAATTAPAPAPAVRSPWGC